MRKLALSVVIPAYNEKQNLGQMISSVQSQKLNGYMIKEIIVACDGCSDGTDKLVKELQSKDKRIKLISGTTRKGKCYRLNQLYQRAKGQIIVQLDADGVLGSTKSLQRLVERLKKTNVVLVSGNNQPVLSHNLFQEIMNTIYELWYEIRKDYKGGDNIFNFHGMMAAMPSDFAKSIHYPTALFADQHYLYIKAKQVGEFAFAKRAVLYFTSPDNLKDYFKQATRSLNDRNSVAEHLGEDVLELFEIDRKQKWLTIEKIWLKKPLLVTLGLFWMIALRLIPNKDNFLVDSGVWNISASTKQTINLR